MDNAEQSEATFNHTCQLVQLLQSKGVFMDFDVPTTHASYVGQIVEDLYFFNFNEENYDCH